MSLLTEQEIDVEANKTLIQLQGLTRHMWRSYGRAIEAKVIEKIKAQGPVVWMAPSGSTVLNGDVEYTPNWTDYYTVPLYRLPEGD